MARKKQTPKAPPQSVDDVLINECVNQITPEKIRRYATFVFRQPGQKPPSSAEFKKDFQAIMDFANLGWTYYHGKRHKEFETA